MFGWNCGAACLRVLSPASWSRGAQTPYAAGQDTQKPQSFFWPNLRSHAAGLPPHSAKRATGPAQAPEVGTTQSHGYERWFIDRRHLLSLLWNQRRFEGLSSPQILLPVSWLWESFSKKFPALMGWLNFILQGHDFLLSLAEPLLAGKILFIL